jgi:hypothetical protein
MLLGPITIVENFESVLLKIFIRFLFAINAKTNDDIGLIIGFDEQSDLYTNTNLALGLKNFGL